MSFYNPYMKHPAWGQGISDLQRTALEVIMAILGAKGGLGNKETDTSKMASATQAPKFSLAGGQMPSMGAPSFSLNQPQIPSPGAPSFSLGQTQTPGFMPPIGNQDKQTLLALIAKYFGL